MFKPSAGVHGSIHENGILLLHVASGRMFQSNSVGAKIWQGVADGREPDAIAADISAEYGVPKELVASNTAQFLADLERQGFVTHAGQK